MFEIKVAKSKGADDYEDGTIPFITNTTLNNGIVKFVKPFDDDKVFPGNTICVSGLGYATLQVNRYLPKGNGGDGASVLVPINEMSIEELIYYTSLFNLQHRWRFSFGRKTSKSRIENLELNNYTNEACNLTGEFKGYIDLIKKQLDYYSRLINIDKASVS
ncbi:MAG TPA: restriction endonuclease subunit S [Anaerovoracaceae bacterium]|nr:restriction endonuclease subunit S [Anaerovoracaceae bacterium]